MDVYLACYGDPPTNLPSGVIVVDATCFYSQASYAEAIDKGIDRSMMADFVRLRMILALFGLERDGSALSPTTKLDVRLAPFLNGNKPDYVWFSDLDNWWVNKPEPDLRSTSLGFVVGVVHGRRAQPYKTQEDKAKAILGNFFQANVYVCHPARFVRHGGFIVAALCNKMLAYIIKMEGILETRAGAGLSFEERNYWMRLLAMMLVEYGLRDAVADVSKFGAIHYEFGNRVNNEVPCKGDLKIAVGLALHEGVCVSGYWASTAKKKDLSMAALGSFERVKNGSATDQLRDHVSSRTKGVYGFQPLARSFYVGLSAIHSPLYVVGSVCFSMPMCKKQSLEPVLRGFRQLRALCGQERSA
jgi:hypothetical protein